MFSEEELSGLSIFALVCVGRKRGFPKSELKEALVESGRCSRQVFVTAWGRSHYLGSPDGERIAAEINKDPTQYNYQIAIKLSVSEHFVSYVRCHLRVIGEIESRPLLRGLVVEIVKANPELSTSQIIDRVKKRGRDVSANYARTLKNATIKELRESKQGVKEMRRSEIKQGLEVRLKAHWQPRFRSPRTAKES